LYKPNDADWQLANAIFTEFRQKPGADHIASEFSLAHVSALVRTAKPTAVLEIGGGIGTITKLLLSHVDRPARITVTEEHPYCLEQLAINIPDASTYQLVTNQKLLDPSSAGYDIVILDGTVLPKNIGFLAAGTHCFVEGNRRKTRELVQSTLGERQLSCHFIGIRPGNRVFSYTDEWNRKAGRAAKRLRIFAPRKGCWIGRVGPL